MARQFSNGNNVTSVSALPSATPTAISFALWFNPANPSGTGADDIPLRLLGGGHGAQTTHYDSSAGIQRTWGVNDAATFISMGTTTAAVWNHLALTWDGTIWRAYLNGIAGATATTTNYWNASQALIVQNNASATTWQMADVAVWSIALAPAQIVDLANGRRADHVVPGNMLIYWPILGQSPEPDKSGNTNNGTVAGTTVVADPAQLEAWSPQYVSLGLPSSHTVPILTIQQW